jgi:hypothetical protein
MIRIPAPMKVSLSKLSTSSSGVPETIEFLSSKFKNNRLSISVDH